MSHKIKPSRTALKVALNIITLGNVPEVEKVLPEGIVDATAELLVTSGAEKKRVVNLHRSPKMVTIYDMFDWIVPGQFRAFAYRKAVLERQVTEGIENGAVQILVLGAGYDTLGYRLATKYPNVNFFEIDQPSTAELKAKGIEVMRKPENLHIISEDLSERKLVDVINSNDLWNPSAKSVFIAEGLLMYLTQAAVHDLFKQCSVISGAESRIAFTYIGKHSDGKPDAGPRTKLLLWILRATNEPWLWFSKLDELDQMLMENGWRYSPKLVGDTNKYGIEFFGVAIK